VPGVPPPYPTAQQSVIGRVFGPGWRFVRGYSGGLDVNDSGHHGWDIAAETGTPIHALTAGTVDFSQFAGNDRNATGAANPAAASAAWASGGGNVVDIGQGTFDYVYAHLDKVYVKQGQKVNIGDVIGTVGQTGDATGPHLHFSIIDRANKQYVNPTAFLTDWTAENPGLDSNHAPVTRGLLSFWGDITYPEGHTLTESDVNDIVSKLDAKGAFGNVFVAREASMRLTQGVLMLHVGQPWNDSLATSIQGELGQAASLTPGAFDPSAGVAPFLGMLADPGHWAMFLAIIGGALMIAIGGWKVLSNAGRTT